MKEIELASSEVGEIIGLRHAEGRLWIVLSCAPSIFYICWNGNIIEGARPEKPFRVISF